MKTVIFGQSCGIWIDVSAVCNVKGYLLVQGGYLRVYGGYQWVQGGYLTVLGGYMGG